MTPETKHLTGLPRHVLKNAMLLMAPNDYHKVSVKYRGEEKYYKTQTLVENFHHALFTINAGLPQRRYKYKIAKDAEVPTLLIKRLDDMDGQNPLWFGEDHKLDATSD
jgi:hypothetical protein